jgi:hypothetical protein
MVEPSLRVTVVIATSIGSISLPGRSSRIRISFLAASIGTYEYGGSDVIMLF